MIYNFIVLLIKGGQDVRGVSFNGGLGGGGPGKDIV